jgi:Lipocalin-like domain
MTISRSRLLVVLTALLSCAAPRLLAQTSDRAPAAALVGTWVLTAADDLRPDGARVPAYGADPMGRLTLDAAGRYSVQIFRRGRLRFATGDKRRGSPDEYRDASLGMSSHFGRYVVDAANGTITFHIDAASFANWEGAAQTRPFELNGDELSWRVPAAADGTTPISVWRRAR